MSKVVSKRAQFHQLFMKFRDGKCLQFEDYPTFFKQFFEKQDSTKVKFFTITGEEITADEIVKKNIPPEAIIEQFNAKVFSDSISSTMTVKYQYHPVRKILCFELSKPQQSFDMKTVNIKNMNESGVAEEDDEYVFKSSYYIIDATNGAMISFQSRGTPTIDQFKLAFTGEELSMADDRKEILNLEYRYIIQDVSIVKEKVRKLSDLTVTANLSKMKKKNSIFGTLMDSSKLKNTKVTISFKDIEVSDENIDQLETLINDFLSLNPDGIESNSQKPISKLVLSGKLNDHDKYVMPHDLLSHIFASKVNFTIHDGYTHLEPSFIFNLMYQEYKKAGVYDTVTEDLMVLQK